MPLEALLEEAAHLKPERPASVRLVTLLLATSTSNRFVHVEQSRAVRDNRAAVIEAFGNALR